MAAYLPFTLQYVFASYISILKDSKEQKAKRVKMAKTHQYMEKANEKVLARYLVGVGVSLPSFCGKLWLSAIPPSARLA